MTPGQLLDALIRAARLNPTALAAALRRPTLQGQITRLISGEVRHPRITTTKPIAEYFGIPIDALLDERAATRVAEERGLLAGGPANRPVHAAERGKPYRDFVADAAAALAPLDLESRSALASLFATWAPRADPADNIAAAMRALLAGGLRETKVA